MVRDKLTERLAVRDTGICRQTGVKLRKTYRKGHRRRKNEETHMYKTKDLTQELPRDRRSPQARKGREGKRVNGKKTKKKHGR